MKKNRSKAKGAAQTLAQNSAASDAAQAPSQNGTAAKAAGAEAQKAEGVAAEKSGNGSADSGQGKSALIEAKIDVGFGNQLYIRGGGAGLSWGRGTVLECADSATWVFKCPEVSEPFEFKLLINDENWCIGANYIVQPGATMQVIPHFIS
jgi:hypothetical protein